MSEFIPVHRTTFAHLCDSQVAVLQVHKLLSPYSYQVILNTSVVNSLLLYCILFLSRVMESILMILKDMFLNHLYAVKLLFKIY